ncbi:MAG: hypothetical protein K5739_08280 [Lachnospiraceae bacterium]|nr:hypothetical protein [Lachnospiraceae bacterium]
MNPMDIMQLGGRLNTFNQQHPRFGAFLREAGPDAMRVGSVLEMKVTSPEGQEYITNIKLTEEDIETLNIIRNMRGSV